MTHTHGFKIKRAKAIQENECQTLNKYHSEFVLKQQKNNENLK